MPCAIFIEEEHFEFIIKEKQKLISKLKTKKTSQIFIFFFVLYWIVLDDGKLKFYEEKICILCGANCISFWRKAEDLHIFERT